MRVSMMDYDLLLQLAGAKVGSAIEDVERAILDAPNHPGVQKWHEIKDVLHDAREALKGAYRA